MRLIIEAKATEIIDISFRIHRDLAKKYGLTKLAMVGNPKEIRITVADNEKTNH